MLNPAMPALLKMLGVCGISFDSLLLTPAARAKAARGKKDGGKENIMPTSCLLGGDCHRQEYINVVADRKL